MNVERWTPTLEVYDPTLQQAARFAEDFVADVARAPNDRPRWLTYSGVTGCGKTMLAEQIFREARKHNPADLVAFWQTGTGVYNPRNRRPSCVWLQAVDFADRVFSERGYVEDLGRDFLVAIDDVGAANDPTRRVAEALYRLCNVRLGKWTIFTTNLARSEVAALIDERVASRMIRDGNVFHRIAAGDYAMKKASRR